MNELFYYTKPGKEYTSTQVLLLRIAESYIGCCVTDKHNTELYNLVLCQADDTEEINITAFRKKYAFIDHPYADVKVAFDYRNHILLPAASLPSEPGKLLETLPGGSFQTVVQTDELPRWNLRNLYAVPREIINEVKEKFQSAKFIHPLSVAINMLERGPGAGLIGLDFSSENFTVIVVRANDILLANVFAYTTPGDVLYYLLNICRQFSLSQDDVQVSLSGMLEKDSSLYKELYQYFIHIEFREADWGAAADCPAHFFTSFNDLALCAS